MVVAKRGDRIRNAKEERKGEDKEREDNVICLCCETHFKPGEDFELGEERGGRPKAEEGKRGVRNWLGLYLSDAGSGMGEADGW